MLKMPEHSIPWKPHAVMDSFAPKILITLYSEYLSGTQTSY